MSPALSLETLRGIGIAVKTYLPFSRQLERELGLRAWSQEKLAGMLKVDPRTVRRWIAGERMPTLKLREELCRVLGKKSVEELGLFDTESDEAEYPTQFEAEVMSLHRTVASTDSEDSSALAEKIRAILRNNAVVDHIQLFGVDEPIKKIREFLAAQSSGWIISLHGEGGIGKTALAYEVASQFAALAGFTRIAWVSAKTSQLLPDGRWLRSSSAELRWASLVKKMADQLGVTLGENSAGWIRDFPRAIRALPQNEKCLLVVDNLETVEDIDEVINFLCGSTPDKQIIKPHKIFITTRYALQGKAQHVVEKTLKGLDSEAAFQLIREWGNEDIERASDQELQPIIDFTEGNPLLIKLLVARFLIRHLPLFVVLAELQQVRQKIGRDIVDYLYVESLQTLETRYGQDAARAIMGAFCPISAGESISYQNLFRYSGIPAERVFQEMLTMACNLSLIRASRLNCQYSIHSLLWQFICGTDEQIS